MNAKPTTNQSSEQSEESRREKKRATDRRAQRDHRLRRKAYVQHLEECVRSLSTQYSSEDRVKVLLQEQKYLREKCDKLTAQLDHVRDVVRHKDGPPPPRSKAYPELSESQSDESLADSPSHANLFKHGNLLSLEDFPTIDDFAMQEVSAFDAFSANHESHGGTGDVIHPPEHHFDADEDGHVERSHEFHDATMYPGLTQAWGHGNGEMAEPCGTITTMQGSAATSMTDVLNAEPHNTLMELTSRGQFQTEEPRIPMQMSCLHQPFRLGLSPDISDNSLDYLCLPKWAQPVAPSEQILSKFVDEARALHMKGKFDNSTPSLRKLFSNPPHDVLAYRLYNYISDYGPIPLHLLLGIFWCQYMFLRWIVLGTRQAYEMMPSIMRPSKLECVIPHKLFIGMLTWPKLRIALVSEGDAADPEAIGIEMLTSLSTRWTRPNTHGMPPNMDLFTVIELQAQNMSFWAVGDEFFKKHPRYAQCRVTS